MKYYDLFSKYIPELKPDREQQLVKCIFHQDDKPSLSINLDEGVFHCFGCGKKGGIKEFCELTNEDFEQHKHKITIDEIRQEREEVFVELDEEIVHRNIERFHNALLQNKTYLDFLINEKLWSLKIIQDLKIGLEDKAYIIPIWQNNKCVAVIKHQPQSYPKYKLIRYEYAKYEGCFPPQSYYDTNYIVVCEGISDTLCLLSLGINAVTPLVPNSPFRWLARFDFSKIENIVICTDNDTPGELIRRKYNEFFQAIQGKKIYNLVLPNEYKDITEYIKNNTKENFIELVRQEKKEKENEETAYENIEFEDIFDMRNMGKSVCIEGFTSSKLIQSYAVPSKYKIECLYGQFEYCANCPIFILKTKNTDFEFEIKEEEQIAMIDKPVDKINERYKKKFGVPKACHSFAIKVTENNLAEIFDVIPIRGSTSKEIGFRPVACIALSKNTILSSSANYKIRGTISKHPDNGQIIIITKSAESFDRVYKYDFEKEEELKYYLNPSEITTEKIIEKLLFVGEDLSRFTGIKNRTLFHVFAFLPFVSPYQMILNDQYEKSALEVFTIGDTRTGKTTVYQKYIELTNIGTLISGENVSLAGLVGGMQQLSYGKWTISWGIFPQNDRGLVIIDEADALPKEVIAGITSVRSSGWAEINKVQQAKAQARIRLVFISNPKNNMNVESYGCGIKAIEDFGYSKQDISRFDYFLILSRNDVRIEEAKYYTEKTVIPMEIYRTVSQRAYSQSGMENIISENVAIVARDAGEYLANKYYCDIPVFSEGYSFLKVLKVALAIKNLLVIPLSEEVVFATKTLLEMNYDNQPAELGEYANMWRQQMQLNKNIVARMFAPIQGLTEFCKKLFMREVFTYSFFQEIAGCNINEAYAQYLRPLIEANAIYPTGKRGEYAKTPEFVKLLNDIINGKLRINRQGKYFEEVK